MKLVHEQTVSASPQEVYEAFMDVWRIGRCFPGAAVTSVEGDEFTGHLTTKVGPFTLTYEGAGQMTLRDPDNLRAALQASGGERHGFGKARLAVQLKLEPAPGGNATVHLDTHIAVHGSPTNLGGGIAQRVSDPLIDRFLRGMAGEPGYTDDAPLDVARGVLPGLVASYGRSISRRFGRH